MKLEKSWHSLLEDEFQKEYIIKLKKFLQEEQQLGRTIFPPEEKIFSAFKFTPFDTVKVVIIGQDPYHGTGQANGLAFSVEPSVPIPPSLKNIYKELQSDIGMSVPKHGTLTSWARQGVLLLNSTLTVREKSPKSHAGKGWEQFTDAVIDKLVASNKRLVFLLWGKFAQQKYQNIAKNDQGSHLILTANHPSPYSAHHFFGCRHFSKTNSQLEEWGIKPIKWDALDMS